MLSISSVQPLICNLAASHNARRRIIVDGQKDSSQSKVLQIRTQTSAHRAFKQNNLVLGKINEKVS